MSNEKKFLLALIFLHLAAALPFAYLTNIWMDEGSTLYSTQNGFVHAVFNAYRDEKQAPLYFIILSLWREVNDSVFFARLFSVICSLAAIKFFYDLARTIWTEKTAFFISLLFAVHPYLFWASVEIRVYSLTILLSVLLFKFFYEGYLKDTKSARVLFTLTAIFSVYTNYYLGFSLVGCFAALLVLREWQKAKIYFVQMLIAGAAILPVLFIIKIQFAVNTSGFQESKSLFAGIRYLWHHILTFVLPTEILPRTEGASFVSTVRLWIVRVGIFAAIVVLAKNKFRDFDKNIIAFGTISAVICLFFLVAYFLLGSELVAIRHASVLFVSVFLFVSLILAKITPRKFWILFAIIYAFFFVYSMFTIYPNFTKRGDWARIANYIERREKPNQPIIVFPAYQAITLPFEYDGKNEILPDERFFEFGPEDEFGSAKSLEKQIEFVISEFPPDADEVWLLTEEGCQTSDACLPLENFVKENYTVVDTKDFYLERVRLLRRK